jgi:hypothetical protein
MNPNFKKDAYSSSVKSQSDTDMDMGSKDRLIEEL